MANLLNDNDFLSDKPLKFEFNLLRAEAPEAWEGWLLCEIKLLNGTEEVSSLQSVTILEEDVRDFCEYLRHANSGTFVPTEPDFQMTLRRTDSDDVDVSVFVDEGKRRAEGYSGQFVGIRIQVMKDQVDHFVSSIEEELEKITQRLNRVA